MELAGHRYDAMSVAGEDLGQANPFDLLADGWRRAQGHGLYVVVVGSEMSGRPGFVILTDRADAATGDLAEGEELQDHDFCPRVAATLPGK